MSEHIHDDELKDLIRSGAKIVARKTAAKPSAPEISDAQKIIAAIRSLDTTLAALADRPVPDVTVAAPQISVEPKINVEATKPAPRRWKVEVTERDKTADQRIKSLTIEAID